MIMSKLELLTKMNLKPEPEPAHYAIATEYVYAHVYLPWQLSFCVRGLVRAPSELIRNGVTRSMMHDEAHSPPAVQRSIQGSSSIT
jgi:hypothetical protein